MNLVFSLERQPFHEVATFKINKEGDLCAKVPIIIWGLGKVLLSTVFYKRIDPSLLPELGKLKFNDVELFLNKVNSTEFYNSLVKRGEILMSNPNPPERIRIKRLVDNEINDEGLESLFADDSFTCYHEDNKQNGKNCVWIDVNGRTVSVHDDSNYSWNRTFETEEDVITELNYLRSV